MKLFSYKTTGLSESQLNCYNATLDTDLIKSLRFDTKESVVLAEYDCNESGNPLDLPFTASHCDMFFKINNSHLTCDISVTPSDDAILDLRHLKDEDGDVVFYVRFDDKEAEEVLCYIVQSLFYAAINGDETESEADNTKEIKEAKSESKSEAKPEAKSESDEDKSETLNLLELFDDIFLSNNKSKRAEALRKLVKIIS